MTSEREKRVQERENLRNIITQWNANRLDLFALSEPNEELEFHGVMRFYFQDSGQKVATKCIRVSSTAASRDVIHTLIEKFRPDIRMLSIPEYALYEIHENGEERKLGEEEKPLLVQLNWHKDDREGRFLLRRMDEKSILPITMDPEARSFRRKLSKREKKEKKKKEKKEKVKEIQNSQDIEKGKDGIAEKLYSELPETSFTRSISNPEAVMRRRRQQKLEKKLQQFRQEGGPEAGGTLRIFGETLNKDVPYKTLLLSTRESAAYVVKEILDKYGMDEEDAAHYCLVQVIIPHPIAMGGLDGDTQEYHRGSSIREYILDDDDCPLSIEKQHNRSKGILTFHIRRRPSDYQPRKRKKKPKPTKGELDNGYKTTSGSHHHHHHHHHNDVGNNVAQDDPSEKLPYLLELNPDGSDVAQGVPKKHRLYLNVTEVGSERSSSAGGQHLQLFGPNVQSRHCVIAHTEGIVTVTPSSRDAETYVNGVRIYETTILQHGVVVRIGKLHTFRFVDPLHDERRRMSPDPRQTEYLVRGGAKDDSMQNHPHSVGGGGGPLPPGSYETTFDADGNVETVSTHSRDDRMSRKSDDLHSHRSFGREGAQSRGDNKHEGGGGGAGGPPQSQSRRGNDPILPAVLEFREEGEDAFLNAVIGQMEPSQVQFKLAPTYILYMAARYRASTHYRPEASPGDRAHRLTALMIKIAGLIHQVIQDRYRDGASLAFWLANASELLHFLKQDRHVCAYTLDAQDLLAESVQLAFRSLVTCQQVELQSALPTILEDRDDLKEEEGTTADVLAVLSSAMSLLRRCRVNAALTIQLFSQLFHHINMWLFNRVILGDPKSHLNYCSALWGVRLKRRLVRIEVWAEKQGLELAADCHLSRIVQAAQLLQSPKHSLDDVATISSACFKLNSWQIQTLLEQYKAMPDEPPISRDVMEALIKSAQNSADELARSDGREVRLEEDPDLQLPFLLPEDGYSCDIIRGVPAGMQDYLQPLLSAGLCRFTPQPTSSGYWTIYMSDQDVGRGTRSPSVQSSHQGDGEISGRGSALPPHNNEPEVVTMKLQKSNSGMGLSIVAARGVGQDKLGIYIKSVVKGGAADQDGRLQAGDQLLKVDGNSLVGISQEKAAELMTRTGPVVTLEVAKQGAIYHGLAALLSQPSPVMQRVGSQQLSIHYLSLAQIQPSIIGAAYNPETSSSKARVSGSHYAIPSSMPLRNSKVVASQSSCNLSRSGLGLAPSVGGGGGGGVNSASLAPPQQWEAVQTLDRSTTTSKQKKFIPRHPNSPFSYLNGQLPALPFRKDSLMNVSTKKQSESRLPPPRPKSEETLLDGRASGSNLALITKRWPSSDLELTAGRPRSDELLPTHPKNCVCERCCPVCRVTANAGHPEKNLYMQTNPAYGISFCELLELQSEEECGSINDMRLIMHTPQTSSVEGENNVKDPSAPGLDGSSSNSGTHCLCTSCLGCQQRQRRTAKQEVYAYARARGVSPVTGLTTQRVHFAAGTVDNQPQSGGGSHPGPRRMSERDIPARIVQDQNHVGGPRMQGSKSVPSLNSEPQIAPVAKPGTEQHYPIGPEPHARHKSGPVQTISRPESTHPQYDPRYQTYGHSSVNPAGQGGTNGPMVNGRHPQHYPQQLTPQQQQALAEERHYQNIGMYQQAGPYSQRPLQQGYGGPQGQQPGPQRPLHGSHSSLLRTTDPAYHHHHHSGQNNSQTMSPSPLDRSRPLSTLVSPREQEQYVNSLNYSNAPQNPSPHHRVNQNQSSGTGSWPRQESLRQSVNYGHRADYRGQTEITEEPDLVGPKSGVIYGQVPQMDSRQRDLLRQEAKMEEMREEVRRREERGDQSGRVSQPNWGPGPNHHVGGPIPASATVVRQGHPTQYATYGSQPFLGGPQHHPRAPGQQSGPPPPTVPKPRPQMQQQQQPQQPWPPGYDGQPDDRHVIYRDSPPPPPPPSSTHPLMQHGPGGPSPAVSYRYGPSGYPPRPNDGATPQDAPGPQPRTAPQPAIRTTPGNGDVPRAASATYGKPNLNQSRMMPDVARVAQVQNQDKKEFGITSPSPWEREEKEKLRKQKLDEARRIRDRDIRELESLPNRTQKQEDCLRALRLEQEFQRRAEEMSNHGDDDEDDDELLDRAENRERILRMQEDLARTRQRRLDWEQEQLQQQQQQQQQHKPKVPEQINQQPNHHNHDQVQDTEGRLHHLRLEEVNRKKELEATKLAEERLLREARRRQEEDYQSGGYIQKNSHNSSGPQRLDTLLTTTTTTTNAQNDIPPALPTSPPPPLENEYHHGNHFEQPNNSGAQRLESLLLQGGGGHSQNMDQKSGAPPPPERKASYDLHNSSQSSIRYTGVLRNGDINHPPPTMQKKVSFHDARLETEINERKNSSTNNDSSYTLDDIDEALDLGNNQVSSASLVLNTSGQSSVLNTSIGSTPGVIGAQEVYRDPRQRIEAERYQMMGQTGARNNLGPEKLSFREKMKMFALETGQDDTPKDKVKISRAQREIETKTTTNNGAIAAATQS